MWQQNLLSFLLSHEYDELQILKSCKFLIIHSFELSNKLLLIIIVKDLEYPFFSKIYDFLVLISLEPLWIV